MHCTRSSTSSARSKMEQRTCFTSFRRECLALAQMTPRVQLAGISFGSRFKKSSVQRRQRSLSFGSRLIPWSSRVGIDPGHKTHRVLTPPSLSLSPLVESQVASTSRERLDQISPTALGLQQHGRPSSFRLGSRKTDEASNARGETGECSFRSRINHLLTFPSSDQRCLCSKEPCPSINAVAAITGPPSLQWPSDVIPVFQRRWGNSTSKQWSITNGPTYQPFHDPVCPKISSSCNGQLQDNSQSHA
jgi:hypothetical protein